VISIKQLVFSYH